MQSFVDTPDVSRGADIKDDILKVVNERLNALLNTTENIDTRFCRSTRNLKKMIQIVKELLFVKYYYKELQL